MLLLLAKVVPKLLHGFPGIKPRNNALPLRLRAGLHYFGALVLINAKNLRDSPRYTILYVGTNCAVLKQVRINSARSAGGH